MAKITIILEDSEDGSGFHLDFKPEPPMKEGGVYTHAQIAGVAAVDAIADLADNMEGLDAK